MLPNTGDTGGNWYEKLGLGTSLGLVTDKVNKELRERLNLDDQAAGAFNATSSHDSLGRPSSGGVPRLVLLGAGLLAVVLAIAYARSH